MYEHIKSDTQIKNALIIWLHVSFLYVYIPKLKVPPPQKKKGIIRNKFIKKKLKGQEDTNIKHLLLNEILET